MIIIPVEIEGKELHCAEGRFILTKELTEKEVEIVRKYHPGIRWVEVKRKKGRSK